MTMQEAIAQQPMWIGLWLNWLFFSAFVLPLALLIWRQSRLFSVLTIRAGILGGASVYWLYDQFGYVKLLGLLHVVFWTPLIRILVSLTFDYEDVIRYVLVNRTPLDLPA